MSNPKASDVLSRMKAAATREKPVATAERAPSGNADAAPAPAAPRRRKVRFTLDLDPAQHKNLKRFALEADADASAVMRALLELLQSDAAVRNAVLTAVSKDEDAELMQY